MSNLYRVTLLTILIAVPALQARSQETLPDSPAPAAEPQQAEPPQTERIVEGRPFLYNFKRALHPLTWLEVAPEPLFRSAENGWLNGMITRKPGPGKVSGVGFGVASMGTGSGLGPVVTFYHKNLFGHGIDLEVPLLYTYGRYERGQAKISVPLVSGNSGTANRLSFDLGTSYSSRVRDDFYGVGNYSSFENDTQFRTVTREASAGFTAQLNERWSSGLHAAYRNVGVTSPIGINLRDAQDFFRDSAVPGLFTGAALRSAVFSLAHNTEERDHTAFKGGREQLDVSLNESAGKGNFSYWKYRFEAQHFFPLTNDARKVIAARALVETNVARSGSDVPFFDMAWLGNTDTLRGFDNFRFRDKSAMAASLEYRYRIWPAMDWGLFIDEGRVAPQLGDFDLHHFHTGYGFRFFVWAKPDLPISIDVGRSNEKWRVYLGFNANF